MTWKKFASTEEVNVVLNSEQFILIYKHSYRCGTSTRALMRVESEWENFENKDNLVMYFVDVNEQREISDLISSLLNVPHQSPQIILAKESKAIYDASHGGVDLYSIEKILTELNEQPATST